MLYNRCLQSVISRLELLSRPALHSLNVNYLVLPISGPGFIFHGRLLGKFINPAGVPDEIAGRGAAQLGGFLFRTSRFPRKKAVGRRFNAER